MIPDLGGSPLARRGIVAALLALFVVAGFVSLRGDSAVFDETAHLPAGLTYLDRGDYRLNPEHPPLFKMWCALPLWIAGLGRPDYASSAWTGRPTADGGSRTGASQWRFGYELLNGPIGAPDRRNPLRLLVPARSMMLLAGVLLGLLVLRWAHELFGPTAAVVALGLYAGCPTMLAHARLVTTDLPVALGFTATSWAAWRFCRQPGWGRALALGSALTLALGVKFSSLLLLPVLGLLATLWILGPSPRGRPRATKARWALGAAGVTLLLAWVGIWAAYGFRHHAATDPDYVLDETILGPASAGLDRPARWAERHALLPAAYTYGLRYFLGGAARRLSYLNGEESLVGRWAYFPEALLLKTPPATLALAGWLAVAGFATRKWRSLDAWFLVLPPLVLLVVSMAGNLNIGHRHLAPLYPPLYVALGGLAGRALRAPRTRTALGVLLAGALVSFAAATPGYLSYFNFLAGGPAGGTRYLLDSNLDWGQDLVRLRRSLERHEIPNVSLAYFGTADPAAHGIEFRKVLLVHDFHPEMPSHRPSSGEVLAISVNLLHGLYHDADRELAEALVARRRIEPGLVHEWLRRRDAASRSGQPHDSLERWLLERGAVTADQLRELEPSLLSYWLEDVRTRLAPIGRAGDSIWIYRIP